LQTASLSELFNYVVKWDYRYFDDCSLHKLREMLMERFREHKIWIGWIIGYWFIEFWCILSLQCVLLRKEQAVSLQYMQVHFCTWPEVREDSGLVACDVVCLGVVSDVSECQVV